MGQWDNESWTWTLCWRRPFYSWEEEQMAELWNLLQKIKPTKGQMDRWEWRHEGNSYSIKSAYHILSSIQQETKDCLYGRVWSRLVPSKICAFVWKVVQDRILSKLNLYKRGIIPEMSLATCSLCKECVEDIDHLLLHCNFASSVWFRCLQWWRITSVTAEKCNASFDQHSSLVKDEHIRAGWDVVWIATMWSIWRARNDMIFNNHEQDANRIFELVQLRSFQWIKNKMAGSLFNISDWILEPVECLKDKRSKQLGAVK